jgi:hypothetical protein
MRLIIVTLVTLFGLLAGVGTALAGDVLEGKFEQRRFLRGFDAPFVTTGKYHLIKGQGLLWIAQMPFQITTVITANIMAQTTEGGAVTFISVDQVPQLSQFYQMLDAILDGGIDGLDVDNFDVRKEAIDNELWRAELKPKSNHLFSSVQIEGGAFVDSVVLHKQNGDRDELDFSWQKRHQRELTSHERELLATGLK